MVSWSFLTTDFLEGSSLGLRDKESGEDTAEHEQCVDLKNVVLPWGGRGSGLASCAAGTEGCNAGLGDDGSDFTHAG